MDRAFVGTELKFLIEITAEGFDMETDPFEIVLTCGGKSKTVPQDDIVYDENEGKHYLLVDTTDFCSGTLVATVIAQVPDEDFESGYRREVDRAALITLKL